MPTDLPLVSALAAVFFAAMIQSTTGIGFGLIATPFLLVALTGPAAVQITIMLSLGMSAMLCFRSYRDCDVKVLRTLIFGGAVGLPIGPGAFRSIDSLGLRLFVGTVVLLIAVSVVWRPVTTTESKRNRPIRFLFGASILSGAMGVCLAMPGPAVIGPIRERCESDQTVRATIFAYCVLVYGAAFGLQLGFTVITAETARTCLLLLPAMVIGTAAGHVLAPRLSPREIKASIVLVLIATSLTLIVTTIGTVL